MTWYRELGLIEYIFIGIFIVLYLLYLGKVHRAAVVLKTTTRWAFVKFLLRSIYFALLLLAIMGPSFGESQREVKSVGKDIYIAVDLSNSMNAIDVAPSRLEKVKYELKNMVTAFSSDRIGIIIFGSEAFVQCPLTYDQSALNLFIETLNTGLVPSGGTDFAAPLKMALSKQTEEAPDNTPVKSQAKVLILISDGEDFGEETEDVAKELEANDVRIFTLGVGTAEGSRIPYRNSYKRDASGREVVTTLNSDALKELAQLTGGKYFEISNKQNDVSRMIAAVNQIEGQLRDTRKLDVSANKYYYFLFCALLLIALDVLITVKVLRI